MDLRDERNKGSESFNELLNGKAGTSGHGFWFSARPLSHTALSQMIEQDVRAGQDL